MEAYPQPSLVWIVRYSTTMRRLLPTTRTSLGSIIFSVDNGNPYTRSELTIDNLNLSDGGDYICAATADKYSFVRSSAHSITVICKVSPMHY